MVSRFVRAWRKLGLVSRRSSRKPSRHAGRAGIQQTTTGFVGRGACCLHVIHNHHVLPLYAMSFFSRDREGAMYAPQSVARFHGHEASGVMLAKQGVGVQAIRELQLARHLLCQPPSLIESAFLPAVGCQRNGYDQIRCGVGVLGAGGGQNRIHQHVDQGQGTGRLLSKLQA